MAQLDVTALRNRLVHQAGLMRLPRQPGRGRLVGGVTIVAALLLWYVLTNPGQQFDHAAVFRHPAALSADCYIIQKSCTD